MVETTQAVRGDSANYRMLHSAIQTCENFLFETRVWKGLPNMREARSCFNLCLWNDMVYVCGPNSSIIEAFLLQSEQFIQPYNAPLPDIKDNYGCMYVENDLLVVHSKQYSFKFAASQNNQLVLRSQEGPHSAVYKWVNSQPVVDPARRLVLITQNGSVLGFNMDTGAKVQ